MSASTPSPAWSHNDHGLGIAVMDEHHARFVAMVDELTTATDSAFTACFARLHEQTRTHFEDEQALMQDSGFPAIREHVNEHRRILAEFAQFQRRAERGLIPFARAYVRDRLGDWFALHLVTMDAALAAHLKRR